MVNHLDFWSKILTKSIKCGMILVYRRDGKIPRVVKLEGITQTGGLKYGKKIYFTYCTR